MSNVVPAHVTLLPCTDTGPVLCIILYQRLSHPCLILYQSLHLEHEIPGNGEDLGSRVLLSHLVEKFDDVGEIHVAVQYYVPEND